MNTSSGFFCPVFKESLLIFPQASASWSWLRSLRRFRDQLSYTVFKYPYVSTQVKLEAASQVKLDVWVFEMTPVSRDNDF